MPQGLGLGYRIPKKSYREYDNKEAKSRPKPRRIPEERSSANRGSSNRGRRSRPKPDTDEYRSRPERECPAKPDRPRSEYPSPKSFLEAWSTKFFTPAAILMVTASGLVVDTLPALHGMPIGGRLAFCTHAWKLLTENKWIRNIIRFGYKIPLWRKPYQKSAPKNPSVTPQAHCVLVEEAKGLLGKKAIAETQHCEGEYLSSYFAVPKPRSDKWRPILNLKYFNENICHYKFKMECFSHVREFIQPNSYLIGIDLKDQFLSVPMNRKYRKYLRFSWMGKLYEWCVLPFGLKCSPRIVTKLLKPVMGFLRACWNVLISVYMDDMILQGKTKEEVYFNAQLTILLLLCLGWEVNWEKSNLTPSQTLCHLGFDIDTVSMTASCPAKKVDRLVEFTSSKLADGFFTVHEGEKLLGLMESVRPVTPFAALHYRSIQKQLLKAKQPMRDPNKLIFLSPQSSIDLQWWAKESGFRSNCSANLREPSPTLHIWSDASMEGAGAHTSRGEFLQREWTQKELDLNPHINLLELRSAREAVVAFARPGDHVRLHVDSKVAAAYLKKQGGTRSNALSQEACLLWGVLERQNVSLLTPHWISTKENICADFLTRQKMLTWEIELDQRIFQDIVSHFGVVPTLDFCHSGQQEATPVHVLVLGQGCRGSGCPAVPLGQSHIPVPSPAPNDQGGQQGQAGEDHSHPCLPTLADLPVVAPGEGTRGEASPAPAILQADHHSPRGQDSDLPGSAGGTTYFRGCLNQHPAFRGLDEDDVDFLSHHLSRSSTKNYTCSWKKFSNYCRTLNIDPFNCQPQTIVKYLRKLYGEGAQFRTINLVRSAISKLHIGFNNTPAGQHLLVKQALKAIFRLRPLLPRYTETFDVKQVFVYIKQILGNDNLLSI